MNGKGSEPRNLSKKFKQNYEGIKMRSLYGKIATNKKKVKIVYGK